MPPKENLERACEECIHFFACSRQCSEPMAQRSATGCECYEPIKSSMAYYVGTLDGAKGKIPNRLREIAEAEKDGRVVVLPCKVGQRVFALMDMDKHISECEVTQIGMGNGIGFIGLEPIGARGRKYGVALNGFGKTVFLTREEAEKALEEREGKKDG